MRQRLRVFLSPGSFFNQLQWSTHHWFIILTFLAIASVESYVGKYGPLYHQYSQILQAQLGVSFSVAAWIVSVGKLLCMLVGAYLLTSVIWIVGNFVGHRRSKRVLFRRMAVVLTVFLLAYTASHLTATYPILSLVSGALSLWGAVLAYYMIKEQFEMGILKTALVYVLTFFLFTSSWNISSDFFRSYAQNHFASIARQNKNHRVVDQIDRLTEKQFQGIDTK